MPGAASRLEVAPLSSIARSGFPSIETGRMIASPGGTVIGIEAYWSAHGRKRPTQPLT